MSGVEWALNLSVRKEILDAIDEKEINKLKEEISLIKTFGMLSRLQLKDEYEFAKWNYKVEKLEPGHGVVYSLPLERAVDIYEYIRSATDLRHKLAIVSYKEVFRHQWDGELDRGDEFWLDWYENHFLGIPYDEVYGEYGSFSPHICVDLEVTEEMLIEGFKNWLKSARKKMDKDDIAPPGKLSNKLIQKWVDSAVLPYLDLQIYEHLEGVDLPLHVIGDAIFPSWVEVDTAEAVRKTTRQHAKWALRHVNIILRQALIAEKRLEIAE